MSQSEEHELIMKIVKSYWKEADNKPQFKSISVLFTIYGILCSHLSSFCYKEQKQGFRGVIIDVN